MPAYTHSFCTIAISLLLSLIVLGCGSETDTSATTPADAVAVDAASESDGGTAQDGEAPDVAGDAGSGSADAGGVVESDAGAVNAPSWSEVHKKIIIDNSCNNGYCHGGSAGALSLSGDAKKDHAALLAGKSNDKGASKCSAAEFVVPGKPEQSLLWLKLDAGAVHGCGKKMPPSSNGKGLDPASSNLLKAWIAAGAKL
ncbi:MAG: hypothetical protein KC502_13705 [Myxococcales bacterium]|nr:hypothetical protein [Myxococcales bacterium]